MTYETSHTDVEARLLDDAIHPGARVLEIGCGRTTRLEQRRAGIAELVGVDVDVQAGSENPVLDRFVAADCCAELPFDDRRFDLVYANFVVEHLEQPRAAFTEWQRLLRRGGGRACRVGALSHSRGRDLEIDGRHQCRIRRARQSFLGRRHRRRPHNRR
jgi:ubiquinone/menaquinone biosynthesis C-methylase UbiE